MNLGPTDDDHGNDQPRRSTFSPPEVDQEVPLNLGDDQADTAPPAPTRPPVTPPPVAPVVPSGTPSIPPPPARSSLSDQEIFATLGHGGNTEALMNALQEQVELRKIENEEFESWAELIRQSTDEDAAESTIAQARIEFGGYETGQIPIVEVDEEVSEEPVALVEPEAADDLADFVLPRLGQAPVEEDPAPAEVSVESVEEQPAPLGEFEQVLSDEDAVSPPTNAWPLPSVEQSTPEPLVEPEPVQEPVFSSPTPVEPEPAPEPELDVPQPVSAKEPAPSAEMPGVALTAEQMVFAPAKRLSFDHVGEEISPDNARSDKGLQLFWTWWAVGAPIVGVLLGAYLVDTGLNLVQAVIASILGVVVASLPVVVGTIVGIRTGLPTLVASRAAYGLAGNIIPAIVMTLVRILVAGVFIWSSAWMVSGILLESNYWNGDPAIIEVITGAIAVVATITLALIGRGMIQWTLWVSAGLATLGLIFVVVVTAPVMGSAALAGQGASTGALIAAVALVMSVFMITWAHFGTDLARFHRPYGTASGTSLAALGAVVPPILVLAWGAMLAASDAAFREALFADFFDTVLELAPEWYPIPAVLVLALPLIGLAALALHSAGYAVISLGVKMSRYVGVAIAGAIAALIALGIVVFIPGFTHYLSDLALITGVLVASVVGGISGEVLTRRVHLDARLLTGEAGNYYRWRIAPVIGFVVAADVGLGLVETDIPGLSWIGYHVGYLSMAGIDVSGWQMGPLAALIVALAFNLFAGIKTGVELGPEKAAK